MVICDRKRRYPKGCMEQLIIFEQDGSLELDGFPLHIGDRIQILLSGSWVSGSIVRDRLGGWHILTGERASTRLQTGFIARLLSLSPETEPQIAVHPDTLGDVSPQFGRSSSTKLPNGDLADSRARIAVPRKCSLLAVPDTTREG
jgi:Domain of unknown function (DUF5348)